MQRLIAVFLAFLTCWIITLITETALEGPYVSKQTEDKYLRNLYRNEWINESQCYIYNDGDSIAGIATTAFWKIDPFHKWYIMEDVGPIDPRSPLSKALDSLSKRYVKESNNKYK